MRLSIAELRAAKVRMRFPGQNERAVRRQRASPEHDEQVAVFAWAAHALVLNRYPELELLHAVPNGEKRDWKAARRLKAEGVKSGMPDINLPVARGPYIGLHIEMKSGRNRPTANQQRKLDLLAAERHRVSVQRSADAAIREIEWYLNQGASQ